MTKTHMRSWDYLKKKKKNVYIIKSHYQFEFLWGICLMLHRKASLEHLNDFGIAKTHMRLWSYSKKKEEEEEFE